MRIEEGEKRLITDLVTKAGSIESLASWLSVHPITINKWLRGGGWRSHNRDAVHQLHAECFPLVESTLRRLYRHLKDMNAPFEVLATVAMFIVEEENQ